MHEMECNGRELLTIDRRQARSLDFDKAKKEGWEFQLLGYNRIYGVLRLRGTTAHAGPDPGWDGLIWMFMRGNSISLTRIVSRYEKESITTLEKSQKNSGSSLDAFLLVVTCDAFRVP